ncbi:MAG: HAD family phosphatase [Verrucomicrobia bacterium]|nr:HAD family phosphatase [Verrucomicrobiota bacterium]
MRFDLIAIDLDSTLLSSEGKVTPRTRAAVDRAHRAGVEIVICTGRRFSSAMEVLGGVSFADHIVVNNGVVAKEVASGETVYSSFFTREAYRTVIGALKRLCPDTPALVMVDEYPAYEYCADVTDGRDAARGANAYHMEYIDWNPRMLRAVETLEVLPTERVIQCCIMHEGERLRAVEGPLAEATRGLAHVFTVRNTKYSGSSLEVLPEGASKWRALQFLAASYSIPPQRIMAIGDDLNDLAMIEGAGFGVAMANAVEPVRRIADWITADKDHDGVAEAIERCAFEG